MKLKTTQTMRLDNALKAHRDYRNAQATAQEEALRIAADNVASFSHDRDRAIRLAIDEGVPKDRIRRLLQIGHQTLAESLARTQDLSVAPEVEEVPRFAWADDTREYVRVSLAGAWWDTLKAEFADKIRKNADADSAVYPILDDGTMAHRTDWTDRTTPNKYDNPVSAWLSYYGGAEEAAEWLEGQE